MIKPNGNSALPVILNFTESANAGDVLYLQGSNFGSHPVVEYSYDNWHWKPIAPLSSAHNLLTLRIPTSETRLPDLLNLRVSSDNQSWSAPVCLNRARVLSMDTDQVAPGSPFRILGRNLIIGRTPTIRFVDAKDATELTAKVDVKNSSEFLLKVNAPSGVRPGHSYRVSVNNAPAQEILLGRASGPDYWQLGVPWAADLNFHSNRYDTQTDPRLKLHTAGNGLADDTAALRAAVQTAGRAGGGVVFLPPGHYKILFADGCGVTLPNRVVLMGAGRDQTTLNYGNGPAPPPEKGGYAVCFGNQTGVSDLTLNNVNESGRWPQSGWSERSQEVFLQRVDWNLATSEWITLTKAKYLTIQNSKITQTLDRVYGLGPLNLEDCSWCEIKGNTIQFATRGIVFDRMLNGVFENNQVVRDISQSPDPKAVTHSIAASFAVNLMILNNSFSSQGGALATNNDGEVLNSEGGGPIRFDEFRGTVSASSVSTLTDTSQNFHRPGQSEPPLRIGRASVAIVSGNGMGQVRAVTGISADGHTLTVDRPWDATVEAGSHFATFDWSASNWIVVDNTLTGNFKGIEIFDGSASDILIKSNTLADSGGIMISPTQNPPGVFQVVRNLDIIDNTISDEKGLRPAYIGIIPREDGQTTSFGTSITGARVQGNRIVAHDPNVAVKIPGWDDYKVISEGYLNYWDWQSAAGYSPQDAPPPILGTIFQSNSAQNSRAAFVLNTGASETVIQGTTTQHVSGPNLDQIIPGSKLGSENTITP